MAALGAPSQKVLANPKTQGYPAHHAKRKSNPNKKTPASSARTPPRRNRCAEGTPVCSTGERSAISGGGKKYRGPAPVALRCTLRTHLGYRVFPDSLCNAYSIATPSASKPASYVRKAGLKSLKKGEWICIVSEGSSPHGWMDGNHIVQDKKLAMEINTHRVVYIRGIRYFISSCNR